MTDLKARLTERARAVLRVFMCRIGLHVEVHGYARPRCSECHRRVSR